jgi:hypothetical protein
VGLVSTTVVCMEIGGLPLHPLVVHGTVVFTPLAALALIVFAVMPRYRYLTRWPTAILAVAAFGSVWAARFSGQAMLDANPDLAQLVQTHMDRGKLLSLVMILFLVVALVAVWDLGGPTGLVSGRGARETKVASLDKVLPVVVVIVSLVVLGLVIATGDAGSRAVFG